MNTAHRLHSMDNLRASMMWLGIVLHVAVQHVQGESPLPWRDRATSPLADLLMAFIHAFRMPVFFIVAGFFLALLVQRRGLAGMLQHRFQRLALPFLLFWPPIAIGMVLMVLVYVHRMVHGSWGIDLALRPPPTGQPLVNTFHLWFLYLLWWFAVLTAAVGALGRRLGDAPLRLADRALQRLGMAWWGFAVLALPLMVVGAPYRNGIVAPLGSLLPPLAEWLHNGLFFVFGLALWSGRERLLPRYTRRCWAYLAAGLPLFLLSGALVELGRRGSLPHASTWIALVYNACSWLWCFGLIGLFARHMHRRQPVLAYLADSSYWVYLVHMLGTIGFGALVYGWPIGAWAKIGANIALTTAAGLASYQLLVRHTWVGRLLNGPRGEPAATAGVAIGPANGR